MNNVVQKNPGEFECHQAVHEVVESLWEFLEDNIICIQEFLIEL